MASCAEPDASTLEELLTCVARATAMVLDLERNLLFLNVHERSLTHQLAKYFELFFKGWDVDCEYNRDLREPKRIDALNPRLSDDPTDSVTIFPDIVIHHRNTAENYVAIEVKKATNRDRDLDQHKLRELTSDDQFHYRMGLFLEIDCRRGFVSDAEVYRHGSMDEPTTKTARKIFGITPAKRRLPKEEADFHFDGKFD